MNEKLIEEARRAKRAVYLVTDAIVADDLSRIIGGLADALEAAEAHTPECEMCRWENGFGARKPLTPTCEKNLSTDDFPHGHPEMDPTDDERVNAALNAHRLSDLLNSGYGPERFHKAPDLSYWHPDNVSNMRAALRAANEVRS